MSQINSSPYRFAPEVSSRHEAAHERVRSVGRLLVVALLISVMVAAVAGGASQTFGQTTAPTPPPPPRDARGIDISNEPAQTAARSKTASTVAKPELVLQSGYGNFFGATKLIFSPDGRLLATTTLSSGAVKLWETATGRELRTLGGTSSSQLLSPAVAFSRDSQLLAIGAGDNTVSVWDVKTGRAVRTLTAPSGSLLASFGVAFVGFSSDGRTLVSISDALRTWDVATGQQLRSAESDPRALMAGLGNASGYALSPDGNQLAGMVTSNDGKDKVRIWDVVTGRELRALNMPDDDARSNAQVGLTFTSDGRVLAAALGDGKLRLWDVTAKSKARVLTSAAGQNLSGFGFSPDGRFISLSTGGYAVKVWETATTGREVASLNVPNGGYLGVQGIANVGFSHDGRLLATGGFNTQIVLWEVESGKSVRSMSGKSNMAYDVAFSADGTQLASGGRTRWDLATGRGLRLLNNSERIFGFSSSDGRLLAVMSLNRRDIKVIETASQRELYTLTPKSPDAQSNRAYFSPDGRLLITTYTLSEEARQAKLRSDDATADVDAKAIQKAQEKAMKEAMKNPAALMKNPADLMKIYNQQLAPRQRPESVENQIKIWDAATGREVRTLDGGGDGIVDGVMGVEFSGDGRIMASLNYAGQIKLWDVATGREARTLGASPSGTSPFGAGGMPTSPDDISSMIENTMGAMAAAGSGGRTVYSIAFSPDGRVLAAGGLETKSNFDMAAMMSAAMSGKGSKKPPDTQSIMQSMTVETTGQIKLWDVATGQQTATLTGHGKGVQQVAFSADGRLLASSGLDRSIKIWDVAAKREIRTLAGHTANVESMAFSPDARLLASAGDDGSTFIWDVPTGEHLVTLISLYDGGDWLVVTPDGLFDGSPQAWNQILWRYDNDTFNVAPIEWFFTEFYYPGLLADIFAGKRPRAAQDVSQKDRRQPVVKLSLAGTPPSPATATTTPTTTTGITARNVSIKIEVTDAPADRDNPAGSGARDLRLFRNGSLVKAWRGDVLAGQSSATLEVSIPLIAGENRLTAYAFNRDNVKSKDAPLLLTGGDALKRAGTLYVLAVGINTYANDQYNLKYAVADARSFGEEVLRQQATLGKYARTEVVPLLNTDATKANILLALKRLSGDNAEPPSLKKSIAALDALKPAQPEDAVIIYFAGHGTAQAARFYLIPHDLGYTGQRTRLNAEGLKSMLAHSISDEELEQAVEGVDAGQLLMVIDACNSGQALEAEEKRRGPMNSKGLAQLAYEKGMYILTAAQSYQAALEAAQLGHGYLTYALVEEGLKSPRADAAPKDGVLVVREWLDYATERVPQMQVDKMQQGRALGLDVSFVEGEEKTRAPEQRSVQRPRVFYRRELETNPLVVAKP